MKKLADKQLVDLCLKNRVDAQKELYDRFSYTMFGICLRYAENREEAEDLLQESFIKVYKNLASYSDFGPLGGWIRRIVLNTAIENCRKKKNKTFLSLENASKQFENREDDAVDNLALEDLVKKIQQLPHGYRAVFNLFAIEGYGHTEIAEQMGITVGTSKSQYSKARAMLRAMIEEENVIEKKVNYGK